MQFPNGVHVVSARVANHQARAGEQIEQIPRLLIAIGRANVGCLALTTMGDLDVGERLAVAASPQNDDGHSVDAGYEVQDRTSHRSSVSVSASVTVKGSGKGKDSHASGVTCYLSGCSEQKSHKSQSCSKHQKVFQAMMRQAKAFGSEEEVKHLLADATSATELIKKFEGHIPSQEHPA